MGLRHWLRAAENFRKAGRAYREAGDLEAAFVEFGKSVDLIFEKIPHLEEYSTLLTATHRHNLGLVSPSHVPSWISPFSPRDQMDGCKSRMRCASESLVYSH